MIIHALIDGRPATFNTEDTRRVIGEGGEGVVMRWDPPAEFIARYGTGKVAVKLCFETGGTAHETAALQANKAIRQQKWRSWPTGLPRNAISPLTYVTNKMGELIGYVMPLIENVKPLTKLMDKNFRKANGITQQRAAKVLINLHGLLARVHKAGVVVGDFNDKNVLVNPHTLEVFLIDVDSASWGRWPSLVAVPDFADPTLLTPQFTLRDGASYSQMSDWYSFTVMAYQLLTLTNPYRDGVHRPKPNKDGTRGKRYNFPDRVTHRISVFEDVQLPPKGIHRPASLPDRLGLFMRKVFTEDWRALPFPLELLTTFVWMTCPQCGREHGRTVCPNNKCGAPGIVSRPATAPPHPNYSPPPFTPPPPAPSRPTASGTRSAYRIDNTYLAAASLGGNLRHVHYANGAYRRENGAVVLRAPYVPGLSAYVAGDRTVLAGQDEFVVLNGSGPATRQKTQQRFNRTTVAANSKHIYWLRGASLVRDDPGYSRLVVDTIVPNATSVWAGETFGVVFMQIGMVTWVRTFDAENTGFTGSLYLPPEIGTVVDAQCVINDRFAWLTVTYQARNGTKIYKCFLLNATAGLVASAQTQAGSNNWIEVVSRSALAIGDALLVPVPQVGIMRIRARGHTLINESVHRGSQAVITNAHATVGLCLTASGLVHVGRKSISPITSS